MDVEGIQLVPEAVVVLDGGSRIRAINDRATGVLGIGERDVGRPLEEVLELRDAAGRRCAIPPPRPRAGDRIPERLLHVEPGGRAVSIAGRYTTGGFTLTARPAGRREARSRRQADVVATVSHEIRSPLTSIKGFTRTLLARWDRFSDDQKRALLETVDADADRVTRLLLDLLETSRIDADRVTLRRAPVDLVALVDGVLDRARMRDGTGDRPLRLHADPDLPRLTADAGRLEQVVGNLVDNALRYADTGPIDVHVAQRGDRVVVTVADEGPGIAPELRPRIFERFARGRDARHGGTGLGLYITHGLVAAHGGTITLRDTDVGACFEVELPLTA